MELLTSVSLFAHKIEESKKTEVSCVITLGSERPTEQVALIDLYTCSLFACNLIGDSVKYV